MSNEFVSITKIEEWERARAIAIEEGRKQGALEELVKLKKEFKTIEPFFGFSNGLDAVKSFVNKRIKELEKNKGALK